MAKNSKRKRNPKRKVVALTEPETKEPQHVMAIQAQRERLLGGYSNVALIQHTKREFVLDFLWRIENYSGLVSRIITSPQHAKELHVALERNIERYEKKYGKIRTK